MLDEATSALASEVEAAIQDQLVGLIEGKTVIAIARQLSLNPGRHAERRRLDVPPLTVPAYGIRG
jgi:ABC-type bacteriocin/lantibiotic exporter with double-glycine peptidase domain